MLISHVESQKRWRECTVPPMAPISGMPLPFWLTINSTTVLPMTYTRNCKVIFVLFVRLGVEPKSSCILGKCPARLYPQPIQNRSWCMVSRLPTTFPLLIPFSLVWTIPHFGPLQSAETERILNNSLFWGEGVGSPCTREKESQSRNMEIRYYVLWNDCF